MPRKPPGYYHLLSRGIGQRTVFNEAQDYEDLEELMCFYAKALGRGIGGRLSFIFPNMIE